MSRHLIEILLPVCDNAGQAFPQSLLEAVKEALVSKFGGVTAFERSPAQGVWTPYDGLKRHDEVVTVEVMVDDIDERWWTTFRATLEREFHQEEIVIRAFPIRIL